MKVLHSPIEIAGQMGMLCQGLRRQGWTSVAYNTFHSYLGYKDDVFNTDIFELEWMLRDLIGAFDVFHFHYASSLLPGYADLPMLRQAGKPMVMHHWGNDVRTHALATRFNKYAYTGDSPPEEQIHASLTAITRDIGHAIVQDYEVYPYVEAYYRKVYVLPITMDVAAQKPMYPDPAQTEPLILHAPTNPLFKGTAPIEQAIERLREEGYSFRYRRIEKMSNKEALTLYRNADIVVDQILCGSYGMLAVEAMSLGKPVVGHLREDLLPLYPWQPPIVRADPSTIYDTLKELLLHPTLRVERGKEGRTFAERYHDLKRVTEQLIGIYREIGQEGYGG